jgi:hypothetical protein
VRRGRDEEGLWVREKREREKDCGVERRRGWGRTVGVEREREKKEGCF